MKKSVISVLALMAMMFSGAYAQETLKQATTQTAVDSTFLKNWAHSNFQTTQVYGVATHEALAFLKEKNRKPQPIVVGVLDSGVEYYHEDLKNNMWVNPKEKAGNKKDDDKNGYTDDIHGWSFLATQTGESYSADNLELTRQLAKYNAKAASGQPLSPKEQEYYLKLKRDYYAKIGRFTMNKEQHKARLAILEPRLEALKKAFKNQKLTKESISEFNADNDLAYEGLFIFTELKEEDYVGKNADDVIDSYLKKAKTPYTSAENQLETSYNLALNPKSGVSGKLYGNADVKGLSAGHGTHVAGIIAAEWGNDKGIYGTGGGNHVKIMGVAVVPEGDERDEDIANGIYYAVNNGAKILNMSFGKGYSENPKLVQDAFRYAESKDVLIVTSAGNSNLDTDVNTSYPTIFVDGQPISKSVLVVGASSRHKDNLKARFSNYGKKTVDVFAPGTEYYSTYPGTTTYKFLQGTSMASPAVAGVAALVWSHYPKLKATDIRTIIMETVNKNDQLMTISVSGGVVDAYKAVQKAEEIYKQRKLK